MEVDSFSIQFIKCKFDLYPHILGRQLHELSTRSAARTCGFSYSGHLILYSTDEAMGHSSKLFVCDLRDKNQMGKPSRLVLLVDCVFEHKVMLRCVGY